MATIIDFNSRRRSQGRRPSCVSVLAWDDPILCDDAPVDDMVLIDGIVSPALAAQIVALCDRFNGERT